MPIYEYECKKCGKTLEILVQPGLEPRLCGYRCVAEDRSGDGELARLVSAPAKPSTQSQEKLTPGKLDPEHAAEKGFTTYRRVKCGRYERVAGQFGPKQIRGDDD